GPLLPGFYEEWISPEAARLDGTFLRVAARLVPLLLSAGELEAALAHARRAVAADPLSEGATRQLMQVLAAAGAPSQAHRIYQVLEARLREVGEAPSPALQGCAAGLRSHAPLEPDPEHEVELAQPPSSSSSSSPVPTLNTQHATPNTAPGGLRGEEFV